MMKHYQRVATYLSHNISNRISIRLGLTLLLASSVSLNTIAGGIDLDSPPPTPTEQQPVFHLQPYTATYTSNVKGVSAEMRRTLKKANGETWQLSNRASILFVDIEESATFSESNGRLIPKSYQYSNKLSAKRNSDLSFDPMKQTVFDRLHSEQALNLPDNSFDKLSFQSQLRLNLMKEGENFKRTDFHLVDRHRLKTYQVEVIEKEQITTSAGMFNTLKIKQQRPGKADYTLIWVAEDWDYFVVRIDRINEGEDNYRAELKTATLKGEKLRGL